MLIDDLGFVIDLRNQITYGFVPRGRRLDAYAVPPSPTGTGGVTIRMGVPMDLCPLSGNDESGFSGHQAWTTPASDDSTCARQASGARRSG